MLRVFALVNESNKVSFIQEGKITVFLRHAFDLLLVHFLAAGGKTKLCNANLASGENKLQP